MAITTAMCTSFKSELLQGIHNFHNGSGGGTTTTTGTGNTFKIALFIVLQVRYFTIMYLYSCV